MRLPTITRPAMHEDHTGPTASRPADRICACYDCGGQPEQIAECDPGTVPSWVRPGLTERSEVTLLADRGPGLAANRRCMRRSWVWHFVLGCRARPGSGRRGGECSAADLAPQARDAMVGRRGSSRSRAGGPTGRACWERARKVPVSGQRSARGCYGCSVDTPNGSDRGTVRDGRARDSTGSRHVDDPLACGADGLADRVGDYLALTLGSRDPERLRTAWRKSTAQRMLAVHDRNEVDGDVCLTHERSLQVICPGPVIAKVSAGSGEGAGGGSPRTTNGPPGIGSCTNRQGPATPLNPGPSPQGEREPERAGRGPIEPTPPWEQDTPMSSLVQDTPTPAGP